MELAGAQALAEQVNERLGRPARPEADRGSVGHQLQSPLIDRHGEAPALCRFWLAKWHYVCPVYLRHHSCPHHLSVSSTPSVEVAMIDNRWCMRSRERDCPDVCTCQRLRDRIGAGINSAICDDLTQALKEERGPVGTLIDDIVDEASEDSFPASDPPAWTVRTASRAVIHR